MCIVSFSYIFCSQIFIEKSIFTLDYFINKTKLWKQIPIQFFFLDSCDIFYPRSNSWYACINARRLWLCTTSAPWNDTNRTNSNIFNFSRQWSTRIILARIFATFIISSTNHLISYASFVQAIAIFLAHNWHYNCTEYFIRFIFIFCLSYLKKNTQYFMLISMSW